MTFYMNSLLYNSLKKMKKCTIDDNDPIMLISIETFKNDYDGFIKLYPYHHQEFVFKTLKTDKDYKKFVATFFCIVMNSGLYNDIKIKPKEDVYYIEEMDLKKLTIPKIKELFKKINETITIEKYNDILTNHAGAKLKAKIIETIEFYQSIGKIKYEKGKLKSLSKSPPKKQISPLKEREDIVLININKADSKYLQDIKKEINEIETGEYSIDKLKSDIKNDKFILKAIDGEVKALEFKLKTYKKLSKVDWEGLDNKKDTAKDKLETNLNETIDKMKSTIYDKLNDIKSNPNKIKEKREALLQIIEDPDNGIFSLKGKSREDIRISLIKIVYMFIEVPTFFFKGFNNYVLTGSAGSGKTKVAGVIANVMKNLGILVTTNVIMATKSNLIAAYQGQSGLKTRKVLSNGLEGVVFIDEAYTLTPCNGKNADSYSEEVIGELINFIDKFIGCIVVIVAGYKDKMMDCFMKYNEGMPRRFPKVIELAQYSSNDLFNIFEYFLNDSIDIKSILVIEQRKYMKGIIKTLNDNAVFNNQAGDMLNLSKIIGEDAILHNKKYNKRLINLSFKKFCLTKNIAIDIK